MKEKRLRNLLLCVLICFLGGATAFVWNAPISIEDELKKDSIWDYSATEERNESENSETIGWNLLDNMETDYVYVEGKVESIDYPYGYNVGYIEDEAVGRAVLLTPRTTIRINGLVVDNTILNIEYMIHPWVAEKSDGLTLNIVVYVGEQTQQFSYEVNTETKRQVQSILLDKYKDEIINLDLYITNSTFPSFQKTGMIEKSSVIT